MRQNIMHIAGPLPNNSSNNNALKSNKELVCTHLHLGF